MSEKLSDYASYELGNVETVPPDVEARIVSGLVAFEQQDEIHWKTRRKLLKDKEALEAKLSKMEELESERDMLRTVLNDTDKAELLEGLEQSTKEALALKQRVEQLETEGCGQCEACEDFFPLSLLSITDDGVALCSGDWDEVLAATADLAAEEEA